MDGDTRIVKNKKELKQAYEDKVDKIIITGEFAKKVHKAKAIRKMTPAKLAILVAALTAAGGGIATSSLTFGTSSVIGMTAVVSAAAKTGLSISAIIAVSSIGLALLLAVFKEYDFVEVKKGDWKVVLKKQKKET